MKGVVLAGGTGSRMYPITKAVNKHLLLVHNLPVIYYPISFLMMMDVRDFLLTTHAQYIDDFKKLLGNGEQYGISIEYKVQDEADGIAGALNLVDGFVKPGENFIMILGDNFFFVPGMEHTFNNHASANKASIYLKQVDNPSAFGVAEIDEYGNVIRIVEKPKEPKSKLAVTGLYCYDYRAIEYSKIISKSQRGELEITDINNEYIKNNAMSSVTLHRSSVWFDCGTYEDLNNASNFVSSIRKNHGLQPGILEEVALRKSYITKDQLQQTIFKIKPCEYRDYLQMILNE